MNATIEYFGQLSEITGKIRESIETPDPVSITELMASLASRYGDAFYATVFAGEGTIHPTLLVVQNEAMVSKTTDVPIEDGATIKLMAPIAGG